MFFMLLVQENVVKDMVSATHLRNKEGFPEGRNYVAKFFSSRMVQLF